MRGTPGPPHDIVVLAVSGLPSVALTVLRIVCCRVAGPAKCAQMMKMGDTDGDGLLSLEEFLQLGANRASCRANQNLFLSRPLEPGCPGFFPDL